MSNQTCFGPKRGLNRLFHFFLGISSLDFCSYLFLFLDKIRGLWSFVGKKPKERIARDVCVSGGKKESFFGKFGVLCFFETPVLRFTLLPSYRRIQKLEIIGFLKIFSSAKCYTKWVQNGPKDDAFTFLSG